MSERSTARGLFDALLLGAAIWGGGAAVFGTVEALTNTATGLYQPVATWVFTVAVYFVLGSLSGLAAGVFAFLWKRVPFLPTVAVGPLLAALFLGGLFFAFVGLPLNDRVLPDTLSVPGLVGNAVFGLVAALVTLVLYFVLQSRRAPSWPLRFLNLAIWLSVLLTAGDHIDVFVRPFSLSWAGLAPFLSLLAACATLYAIVDWALGALSAGRGSIAAPAGVLVVVALAAAALVLRLPATAGGPSAPPAAGRPNVLWLVIDTARADHLTPYGYDRPTAPELGRLAEEGTLFENAFSESSWTIPGHFVMVTGRLDAGREKILTDDFTTAAEVFRGAGYETGAVLGNMSLGRGSGFEQGFGETFDGPVRIFYQSVFEKLPAIKILMALGIAPPDSILRWLHRKTFLQNEAVRAGRMNDEAIEWLDRRDPSRPFFLFINYMDPHDAYDPPAEFREKFARGVDPELGFVRYSRKHGGTLSSNAFVRDVAPEYGEKEWREMLDLYDAEMAYVDAEIGRLVRALEERGLADDTIVVVTADHGELFGEHGLANHFKALTREETHIPLIFRYPARVPAGARIATRVQLRDILPTVLELAGVPEGPEVDGRSLVALMREKDTSLAERETVGFLHRPVDKEYAFTKPGHLLSLRDDDFLYVWSSTGLHAFYDTQSDPAEDRNLHGADPKEAEAARRLEAWRHRAGFDDFGGKEKKVDRLMKEKLKALGYVN